MPSKTISKIKTPKLKPTLTPHAAQFVIGSRVQHVNVPELRGEIVGLMPNCTEGQVRWDDGSSDDYALEMLVPEPKKAKNGLSLESQFAVGDAVNLIATGKPGRITALLESPHGIEATVNWEDGDITTPYAKYLRLDESAGKTVSRETIEAAPPVATRLLDIDESFIVPNPWQPRRHFDQAELQELAQSIKDDGLLQPPIVRECEGSLEFQLIAGERRARACRLIGIKEIRCIVRSATDEEMARLAIAENRDRAGVNPIDEARAYKRLVDEFGVCRREVGEQAGKSRSVISNAMRLLELPETVQQMLAENKLSVAHGRSLARWSEWPSWVQWYAEQIVEERIPVKLVERGFPQNVLDYNTKQLAQDAGLFAEIKPGRTHEIQEVLPQWVAEHGAVFVESFSTHYEYSTKYYVCLDTDLLERLMEEFDVRQKVNYLESNGTSAKPSQADREIRAQTIAKNKARRAALTQIGSEIQAKIANGDGIKHGEFANAGKVEHALLAEIIVNALSNPYGYRPIIEKVAQLHGLNAKWLEKLFDGSQHWREVFKQLAAEKGLAWMVAFWGEVLLVQSITHATKDALELPGNCKYFATTTGIDIPEGAK